MLKTLRHLSADAFRSIVDSIRSPGNQRVEGDQRQTPRVGISGHAFIIPLSGDTERSAVRVRLRDLSAGSIGILHTRAMECGDQFLLCLAAKGDAATSVLCTVTRWRAEPNGLFAIGATFVRQSGQIISDSPDFIPSPTSARRLPVPSRLPGS